MSSPTAGDRYIALNRAPISRAAICRLAADLERWSTVDPESMRGAAEEVGVPIEDLFAARKAIASPTAAARRERERARRRGGRLSTIVDPDFPSRLLALDLPPPVLSVAGELPVGPAVAIVGSRRASAYGLEAARWFGAELAEAGVAVVSGFALGIDGAAHRGALTTTAGTTIAVLGCGLGVDYPKPHRELGDAIRRRGALVSEFPVGDLPHAWHFPVRNRLIAALADVTLVVEAAPRSGSLSTARHALELGRDVAAIPGRIFDETSLGTNALLAAGAWPVTHPKDILERLGIESGSGNRDAVPPVPVAEPPALPARERALLLAFGRGEECAADLLAARAELPVDATLAGLLELELAGWIRRRPGGLYARA